jgi:uncharacterized repeat protein (TIGR01451 family)
MAAFGFFGRRSSRKANFHQGSRSTPRRPARGGLSFETLEGRRLLAADMAEIVGVVSTDLQGDGVLEGPLTAPAQVRLYRDGGNATFDGGAGDDSLAAAVQTLDAQGRYRFAGLTAGRYFVQVELPSGWQFAGSGVREVLVTPAEAEGSVGQAIDGFDSLQRATASPPLPASEPAVLADAGVLGGERDMFVELTQGTDPYSSVSLLSAGGLLRLSSDSTVTGNARIVWDGVDGTATGLNPRGLGGVDLTHYAGNTMTGISLTSGADHPNALIKLRVYSDANNWSEFLTTVPQTPGGAATLQATFHFDDAPIAQAGTGANFADVGALELRFEGVSAVDGQVSLVSVVGRTTKTADFTAAPRLTLGDLVWLDVDSDGRYESGEPGVAGVKLNLYADTNGDDAWTSGVDAWLATTATDASGRYAFANLSPGAYVVTVDAANFATGGALAGLRSSLPASVNPDDNVNDDSNGLAVTAQGVASRAITLTGGAEPVNDGDANPNTNLTLDFGFAGFDVVVDKSAAAGEVYPGDTLTYVVAIRNDGPSIAPQVQFTDWLPAGVEFVSAVANRPGISLGHTSGLVTGNLGDLADGDVIEVTVVTRVRNSAKGLLVNEAEAVADQETYLENNRDSVQNPVKPRIDLSIEKQDSADPVRPGQTFSYILKVRNLGPSTATGVVVTDALPVTGVSFVGASITPTSVSGRELRFDLGEMAAGAERSVTIDVAVSSGFVGTLLNQSHVKANEVETTLVNNQDDETTQVTSLPSSLSGYVYVDRNNDGIFGTGETPLSGVTLTLQGSDFLGRDILRTTTTNAAGFYQFANLEAGVYTVVQTQPSGYRDGKNTIGDNGDGLSTQEDGWDAPDLNDEDDRDADAFEGIALQGGYEAVDYNFGELAINVSKRAFIRSARW